MEKYDTLKFYNENAKSYVEQTKNGDMSSVYSRFLKHLDNGAYILDYGCGSGRDSKYFLEHGYRVKAIDGSGELCKLASSYIGQDVECMTFDKLRDVDTYDGIWACSSIIHVERNDLIYILRKMLYSLKNNGTIYTCFKIGDKEIIQDGKYFNYLTKDLFEYFLAMAYPNAEIFDYFESGTVANVNRPTASWGNYLVRKLK